MIFNSQISNYSKNIHEIHTRNWKLLNNAITNEKIASYYAKIFNLCNEKHLHIIISYVFKFQNILSGYAL